MSVYVMSDLHGEAGLFHAMLDRIGFSGEDLLYILGDVIDRGPEGIGLLQEIRACPNMILLLGNHEHMMVRYFAPGADEKDIRRWDRNGNAPTLAVLMELDAPLRQELLDYAAGLPAHMDISVDGRDYYLVHGFPGENVHDEVWSRPRADTPNPIPDRTLIIGHTPVMYLKGSKEEREAQLAAMIERGERPKIFRGIGLIDIDCGCSCADPLKTLGCLRLDDMAEFYTYN